MNKNRITVADVLRQGLGEYEKQYGVLSCHNRSVVNAILNCRTAALGSHLFRCPSCDDELLLHHSCRNRHCPTCQHLSQAQWIEDRTREVLPVQYFHVVFTLPDLLNDFMVRNKKLCYTMLFDAAAQTLLTLGADKKWLGADIGALTVLHTWGQRLDIHPHLHCIVPGGGICDEGTRFKYAPKDFFVPFKVLASLFRGKFMDSFKLALADGEVQFHGVLREFRDNSLALDALLDKLYKKDWVVFVQESFASPQAVIKYLGQYIHRIAISNKRIKALDDTSVTFSYKDYADKGVTKEMTLSIVEFIRRFLQHVLPPHFVRIRYYGLLTNRNRTRSIARCWELLGQRWEKTEKTPLAWFERCKKLTGKDPRQCRRCGTAIMALIAIIGRSKLTPMLVASTA